MHKMSLKEWHIAWVWFVAFRGNTDISVTFLRHFSKQPTGLQLDAVFQLRALIQISAH
jgi:hypothetical protein